MAQLQIERQNVKHEPQKPLKPWDEAAFVLQPEIFGHDDHLPTPPCYCYNSKWPTFAWGRGGQSENRTKRESVRPFTIFLTTSIAQRRNFTWFDQTKYRQKHICSFCTTCLNRNTVFRSLNETTDHRNTCVGNRKRISFGMSVRLSDPRTLVKSWRHYHATEGQFFFGTGIFRFRFLLRKSYINCCCLEKRILWFWNFPSK